MIREIFEFQKIASKTKTCPQQLSLEAQDIMSIT